MKFAGGPRRSRRPCTSSWPAGAVLPKPTKPPRSSTSPASEPIGAKTFRPKTVSTPLDDSCRARGTAGIVCCPRKPTQKTKNSLDERLYVCWVAHLALVKPESCIRETLQLRLQPLTFHMLFLIAASASFASSPSCTETVCPKPDCDCPKPDCDCPKTDCPKPDCDCPKTDCPKPDHDGFL
eukprot:scaffold58670_cov66-Phaeocystis_antarctica.AAC.1